MLTDNNMATPEIGDVSGEHETIQKSFKVSPDLKNIVLGVGESRDFTNKHKTTKLWFVIPIKSYNVICGAKINEKSAYGLYFGNSKANGFFCCSETTSECGKKTNGMQFLFINLTH
jgi:hypothetical protein